MNFYSNNQEQDRLFLEVSTKYNLAYWIAADIEHFVTNFPELISETDIDKIDQQYKTAMQIFNDAKNLSLNLTGKHRDCEHVLQKFIDFTIKDFDQNKPQELNDSESEGIKLLDAINIEEDFRNNFKKFLSGNDMELYVLISYSYFTKAFLKMVDFSSIEDFDDPNRISLTSREIVKNLAMARGILGECLSDEIWVDAVIDEFVIMGTNSTSAKDMADYCNLNVEYAELWNEFYYVYAEFYKDFIDRNYEFDQLEFDLMSFESTKYLGKINIIAYKICRMILNFMNIEVARVELFTPRTIKSLTNKLEKRCIR